MVEIAICLAIIGIALVAIIGVLPIGINVQRDNREETFINQDATVFIEAIRNGARGLDDLTNYVYAITNYLDVVQCQWRSVATRRERLYLCQFLCRARIRPPVPPVLPSPTARTSSGF